MYSLEPTHKYNIQRRTPNMKISYYVKDSFSSDFTGNLKKLEREVEDVYVSRLRDSCFRERELTRRTYCGRLATLVTPTS